MSRRTAIPITPGEGPPRKRNRQAEWTIISAGPPSATGSAPTTTPSPLSSATQFEFIDVRAANSRTFVQRHSMRHYLRQKRLREIESLQSSTPLRLQWQVRQPVQDQRPRVGREKVTLEDILSDTSSLRGQSASSSTSPSTSPGPDLPRKIESRKDSSSAIIVRPSPDSKVFISSWESELDDETTRISSIPDMVMESDPESTTPDSEYDAPNSIFTEVSLTRYPSFNPQSLLGAGKADPFNTYPIQLNPVDIDLMDYYVSTRCTRASHTSFFRRIVADALQDRAAFHIFLAYSAHHVSSLAAGPTFESRAITHKGEGIRLINKRLSHCSSLRDETIQAIVFMFAIETAFGSKRASVMYLDGLRRMISARGGLAALESPWLLLQICWAEMTGTGRMSMDCIPCCDTGLISNSLSSYLSCPALDPRIGIDSSQNLASLADKFIFSLQDFQLLSFTRQSAGNEAFLSPSFSASRCTSVSTAFRAGTPLRRLLNVVQDQDTTSNIISIRNQCHLASLLYIHLSLWDLRHSVPGTDAFIQTLEAQLICDHLDERLGSIEALLWALLTNGEENRLIHPKRALRTLSMVSVARRVESESWNIVKDILMQGLVLRHWSEVGVLDPRWDAEGLRREILGDTG